MQPRDHKLNTEKVKANPYSVYGDVRNDNIGRLAEAGLLPSYDPAPGKVLVAVLTKEDTHVGRILLPEDQRDTRDGEIWRLAAVSSKGIPEDWREWLGDAEMVIIKPGTLDALDWRKEEQQCRYFEMDYRDIHSKHKASEYAAALAAEQTAWEKRPETKGEIDDEREQMRRAAIAVV